MPRANRRSLSLRLDLAQRLDRARARRPRRDGTLPSRAELAEEILEAWLDAHEAQQETPTP